VTVAGEAVRGALTTAAEPLETVEAAAIDGLLTGLSIGLAYLLGLANLVAAEVAVAAVGVRVAGVTERATRRRLLAVVTRPRAAG